MNFHGRLEPDALDEPARRLRRVHFDLAAPDRSSAVLRADGGLLNSHRPDAAAASEQRTQAVDGVDEIAAVPLHHRQQQVSTGVSTEFRMFERRYTRQQHTPGFF